MTHRLPYIPDELLPIVQGKLHDFNQRRFADKGYYIVLYPTNKSLYYTLWFYNPDAEYHPFIYLFNLELDALSSVRKAMRTIANSLLPLELKEEIASTPYQGDDIVLFGKYRGHHLQSIYLIDPRYINWIADKYEAKTKSERRFKELAKTYNKVFLDLQTKKKYKTASGHFAGRAGEKIENLELTITKVLVEDDYYKTYLVDGVEYFYVDQLLTATDSAGNYFLLTIKAKDRSLTSKTLSPGTHPYQKDEKIHIVSAKVLKQIESHNTKYTKIGYVKFTGNQ